MYSTMILMMHIVCNLCIYHIMYTMYCSIYSIILDFQHTPRLSPWRSIGSSAFWDGSSALLLSGSVLITMGASAWNQVGLGCSDATGWGGVALELWRLKEQGVVVCAC